MIRYAFYFLALTFFTNVCGQSPVMIQQQKMADAQLLVGTWTGSGWITMPDGTKHTFNQTEVVSSRINGGLLTIDGDGKDTQTGAPIHSAFGFFTYDNAKKNYRWVAVSMGFLADVVPEVQPGKIVWTLNGKDGLIRFSIDYGSGEWVEKGELSSDNGKTWLQNFEMRLKKS